MDTVKDLLSVVGRIEEAIKGADAVKVTMRTRMKDYGSVLQVLQGSAPAMFENELMRLQDLFSEIEDLHAKHTADPEDGRPAKIAKRVNRGTQHESIGEALDAIDREVVRQFTAIAAKSSINAEAVKIALEELRPPSLPDMAAVPAGALDLPRSSYVERAAVQEVADGLTGPEESRAPYTVVGMGGGGKSVLASAVVRKPSVREHFRGGIFWVVDALVPLEFKVLLTTRDRSVVGVPAGGLELGDMTEEEALELLRTTSGTVGQPGDDVRTKMTKVVALCGHLPLVLAIAGSMSVVRGKGLTAVAWEELAKELENVAKKMRARSEQSSSIKVVLETSFDSLAVRKQEEFLKMAVLAAGALAPIKMLRNLWEIEDAEGTRDEAEGLVSKCLLHAVGGGGYRVHDLVLEFAKTSIRAEEETMKKATALQAQYLGRLDVLESYRDSEHGAGHQGLFCLDALWRSVEKLSGDPELEVASYGTSLGELESGEATEAVGTSYCSVGFLFNIQAFDGKRARNSSSSFNLSIVVDATPSHQLGKYAEAEPLYERSRAIQEKVLGPEHPHVATSLNNRALLLESQGKYSEAEPLYERCQAIKEKALGREHPSLATTLNNRAGLLKGKYAEAEPLYERCQAIEEKALGPEHPSLATTLNNRAELLRAQGKYEEAEPLYERSQAIREKVLGPEHPGVATVLNNRAVLMYAQEKYNAAIPLLERALSICTKRLGTNHPRTVGTQNKLKVVRIMVSRS
ncbi:NB-ARC and TPR repeat-containing protein-likely pseudogene [Ectocarpus siliculosus]|nr:NB-ARC and TPR repeat-containing protein-likely pseudogene [Ectocarpus siliculosus]|eukprot:CBJ32850.1 NB-ARC and TPR repeat-containing protein-likely pseudogene [Ectocarpus siliculosus]